MTRKDRLQISPARVKLGQWLSEKRLDAKLTQIELAKKVGLKSPQAIANMERGAVPPPIDRGKALCKALGITCDELIERVLAMYEQEIRSRLK